MKIQFTTEFSCPVSQVWSYFINDQNLSDWVPGFEGFRPTCEPPYGPGSTYEMDQRQGHKTHTYSGEMIEFEKHTLLRERITGGSFKPGQTMHMTYTFTDLGARCSMVYENELTCGPLTGLAFVTFGRRYCKAMIRNLKRHAEAASPVPAAMP